MNRYVEKQTLPEGGTLFRVVDEITDDTDGFNVAERNIRARRPGDLVEYIRYVPGAGGDLWFCKHNDGSAAAYLATELVEVKKCPHVYQHGRCLWCGNKQ